MISLEQLSIWNSRSGDIKNRERIEKNSGFGKEINMFVCKAVSVGKVTLRKAMRLVKKSSVE